MHARFYTINIMNPDGTGAHQIGGGTRAGAPVGSPDGTMIDYSQYIGPLPEPYGIFFMKADGSNVTMLTSGWHPAWWAPASGR